jgi:outer membrane protein assembly factor BamA
MSCLRFGREAFTIRHVPKHFTRIVQRVAFTAAAAVCACGGASPVWAQSAAPAAKIGAIRVSGQRKFSAEQVIAATGLKVGQAFSQKDLDAVAERLGKSGAFPDVSYSYVPEGGLISIEFKVEEATKFRACVFDNFVWLPRDEIQAGLKKELPLFIGVVPETGDLLDDISQALEKLSKEKGISVHVTRRIDQVAIGDPNWSHLYSAQGVEVRVQSVRFTGTLTVNPNDLQKETSGLIGREYSEFQNSLFGSVRLVPYYRERGYLQAKVETQAPKILSHVDRSSEYVVETVYAVTEGSVYRWDPPEWSGNAAIAPASLEAAAGMKPNEIANGRKIEDGWQAVQKEYSKSGYVEAKVSPEPVFDAQSLRVHYRVLVKEGIQYHMGTFTVSGVPQKVADRLKDRWRLKSGDVYDGSYPTDFVNKEVFPTVRGGGARGPKVGVLAAPNREQHVMDVTVKVE